MGTDGELNRIVNASGFLFQLRVEHEVRAKELHHRWSVLANEHPWHDVSSGSSGYIDLVLSKVNVRLVIECKRSRDAKWVFLVPKGEPSGKLVRCMKINSPSLGEFKWVWENAYVEPETYLSSFCAVRGSGEGQAPMLERLCQNLLDSLESLAIEEIQLACRDTYGHTYVYVPLVVTNADLQICEFDTKEISLDDGTIDLAEFEAVPFIRFHKSLAAKSNPHLTLNTIQQANYDKRRTVLVVQASYLSQLLSALYFPNSW